MEHLKKYLPLLMFSCKRVSEIIAKNDEDLTFKEKAILVFHGTICRTCQHYKIQATILDQTISRSMQYNTTQKLSESKKTDIIELLKEV
jgi:hypothetical protein